MKNRSGIYQFVNVKNNKPYTGSSFDCEKRKEEHLSSLRSNKHHSKTFQRAFNKYGEFPEPMHTSPKGTTDKKQLLSDFLKFRYGKNYKVN